MAKTIFRLDLTSEEMENIKEKLDSQLLEKFKVIEISDKKIESMQKASLKKSELTRIKFINALKELEKEEIDTTNYNLRKYKRVSYTTSNKYFKLLNIAKKNIYELKSLKEHHTLDNTKEYTSDELCIYEFEKYLLNKKFGTD